MRQLATDLLPSAQLAVVAVFVALALVAVVRAPRSGAAGWWVAATFGSLGVVLLEGWISDALGMGLPERLDDFRILLLLAFPYLLLRFTASFRKLPVWLEVAAGTAAVGVLLATLVFPPLPEGGGSLPAWAGAYIVGALAYWVLVSLVSAVRLWRAGRGQPTVARRRMRLMSAATAMLAVALLVAGQVQDVNPLVELSVQLIALVSGAVFGLGFIPPRALRLSWRRAEEQHLRRGTMAVLRATTVQEIARELLPPTARVVGGGGAALVDSGGRVVAAHGHAPEVGTHLETDGDTRRSSAYARQFMPLGDSRGDLVVWTSPYTPFFGPEEIQLLQTMAAIAGLALERSELLEEERGRLAAVEEAQQEAEQARSEAVAANTAKSEFLSRMSHELRTPLNAVLGFGQLLELSTLDNDDKEAVTHILKAGRHLLALIDDVLDLSRIEAGMLTVSLESVDTGELILDSVALIRPLADSRAILLTVDPRHCDRHVLTDRQRCRQILLNLLSNAIKYNHDGGEVEVRCAPVADKALRVSIRDTGPGIDPARREHLFEPFERLGAETSNVEGTGLGLALTKQLVERMNGAIGVDTAPRQGSTFWIDLPLAERPVHSDGRVARENKPAETGDRTLLLVEDNLTNLRVVEAMLRLRPGVSVLPAMQGRLAIDLANQHQPDVIVLDLHLPDLSGREILQRLRANPRTRDIPVVIASADATPGRVRQLRQEGAFDYVAKPLDLQIFLDVVDAALASRG